jgi:hypothetical protein
MQRDMSSPMDASLSTRNQGQLINTETTVTSMQRVGNLREVPVQGRHAVPMKTLGNRPVSTNPSLSMFNGPGFGVSRAQGLADITVTGLGTTSLKWILASMVGGVILWKLTAGRRAKSKAALSKATAALKDI